MEPQGLPGASAPRLCPVPARPTSPGQGLGLGRSLAPVHLFPPSHGLPRLPASHRSSPRDGHCHLPQTVPLGAHLLSSATSLGLQDLMSDGQEEGSF